MKESFKQIVLSQKALLFLDTIRASMDKRGTQPASYTQVILKLKEDLEEEQIWRQEYE